MTTLRLPRMLSEAANTDLRHEVRGTTVAEALASLFEVKPGLRNHILDDGGAVRPHVSVFVDGVQSDLSTAVVDSSEIRILHAVSGG
ncbi:MAG TPA: MoaD/ThiS family protein [Acidimicrobiia bacterium]|nr:MoaD/ThiS family protein [Acidimicrobiia bacterium]